MTAYPVQYWSESKQRSYDLEEMADPHLLNAERLMRGGEGSVLLESLRAEIQRRGLQPREG